MYTIYPTYTVDMMPLVILNRWVQPATSLTPWVTYEGMDVQQWVQQWRVLTTKLRHLSASKQ